MNEYSQAFKSNMVRKMLAPDAVSANALAAETGLNQSTLSRWLKDARSVGVMDKPAKKWTPSEKLRAVIEAGALSDDKLGEFLRREGLHEAQVREWRAMAESSFVEVARPSKPSPESKRIKELEWEVLRKDKALAEAAALLILQKKAEAIWGARDDVTGSKNER